tara:strand:+ start:2330 stop:3760 length:1431 start_codon:yes stop_codon:yes gene_type:complete
MDLTQRELLARTLQAEAGNQGFGGMVAVGSVIMNRLGGGSDLGNVILKPGQFSAWNSFTGYARGEQGQDMNFTPNAKAYEAADMLLSGEYNDPTGGATHFYNPDISQPSWGESAGGDWQRIGAHIFGKPGSPKLPDQNQTQPVSIEGTSTMDGQPTTAQPNAIQMQQMQQQRSGGLMGFLRDPRTRETFASMDRSGLFKGVQARASADVARANEREKDNRTAQWLSTQPNGQKYAQAIMTGALTGAEAYSQYISDTQGKGVKVGEKLIDPRTGKVIYEDPDAQGQLSKDQNAIINGLNDDLRATYKPYNEISNGYGQIARAIANPQSGVGDLVLTIAFAKILDPGSVVRSEESAAVANAGGGIGAAIKAFNNFLDGSGLLPAPVRAEIQSTAEGTAREWYKKAKDAYEMSVRQAELSGIPMTIIKEVIRPPSVMTFPPLPEPNDANLDTRTQAAKDAQISLPDWNAMNEAERAPFM